MIVEIGSLLFELKIRLTKCLVCGHNEFPSLVMFQDT